MTMMTIVNQGKVVATESTGYVTSVERNDAGQWNFIWRKFFDGNEMGSGSEGPFANKHDAEASRDAFVNREGSKGNVVHSR